MGKAKVAGKVFVLLLVGLVLAFIPVFDILFSDKHSNNDYVTGLIFVGGAYLIAAGITAALTHSWRLPVWLTVPSILVLIEYSRTETQQIRYHVAVLAALMAGTAVGAVVGSRLGGPGGRKAAGESMSSGRL